MSRLIYLFKVAVKIKKSRKESIKQFKSDSLSPIYKAAHLMISKESSQLISIPWNIIHRIIHYLWEFLIKINLIIISDKTIQLLILSY